MIRLIALIVAAIAIGGPIAIGLTAPERVPGSTLGIRTVDLENGRTMFNAGGCASCHASPESEDRMRLGGGRELATRFGTFRVPNLSPHPEDGIGKWSEADFVSAMVKGTSPDGQHYYPAFPYTSYQRMPIGDLRDLYAFIRTLPEVEGRPSGHDLGFPFSLRAGIGLWKYLYLDGRALADDPAGSAVWNRGRYLVEGPGHCAECHSPRDWFGGIVPEQRLAGGDNPTGEGFVPNITQHERALADWGEEDIANLLETGETPDFDRVSGDMTAVVRNLALLSAEDRRAMARYLKSLPAVPTPGQGS